MEKEKELIKLTHMELYHIFSWVFVVSILIYVLSIIVQLEKLPNATYQFFALILGMFSFYSALTQLAKAKKED